MMIEERECATRWRSNDLETGGRVFPTSEFAPAAGGGHGSNSQQRRRPRAWYPEVRFSQRKSFDVDSARRASSGGGRVRVVHRCGFRVTVDYSLHRNTRIILSHSVAVRFALVGYCCARAAHARLAPRGLAPGRPYGPHTPSWLSGAPPFKAGPVSRDALT
jgi:hypothetical protein